MRRSETGQRSAQRTADVPSAPFADYRAFRAAHPERFGSQPDGVALLTDPAEIAHLEAVVGDAYEKRGLPRGWATVGLFYEDPYLVLLRDGVRFPDGRLGVHHRVVRRTPDPSGTAILPILGDKIVLVRHYRHPLRAWSFEAPRGAADPGEDAGATARRELVEELSAEVGEVVRLGHMHGSTGLMGMSVALYLARLARIGETDLGEGIDGHRLVTVGEFEEMVRASAITCSFTLGCFLHARLAGLL